MNYTKQKRINDCLKLCNPAYRLDRNVVKVNIHNSLEHELAKFIKCFELAKDGKEFYTEVIFKTGGRADILVPESFQVFEILHSETEKKVLLKIKYYPVEVDIMSIKTKVLLGGKHEETFLNKCKICI